MRVLSAGLIWGNCGTGCYGEGTQNARMWRIFSGDALISRAESFSYALRKSDLEVWASEEGDVRRQLGQQSHGHILNESSAPPLRSWNVWSPPPHGASVSSMDTSVIASLGPCWLWMFGPSALSRNCCILLYLICMLLSSLWHPSFIRDFKKKMSVVYNWSQSIFQNGWHMTSLLNWCWNLWSPVT